MKYERIGPHEVHPVASIFPMLDETELRALAEDIRMNGLREPVMKIWIPDPVATGTQKPLILDGRNRLRACEFAKVAPDFTKYEGPTDTASLLAFVRSKNLARRHLDESQRALVAARALPLYEAAAKERQRAGGARGGKRTGKLPANVQGPSGEAAEIAARDFNVSARSVYSAEAVEKRADPMVVRAVERGEVAVSAAAKLATRSKDEQCEILKKSKGKSGTIGAHVKQLERIELGRRLEKEKPPGPKGPYRVIVADPPWKYDLRDDDASHRGVTPYPTMTTDRICYEMPVVDIAHDDAILFLWFTNQHVRDATEVAIAWGFAQKGVGTWVKPKIGLGHILRNRTEHFLICTRGKPKLIPCGPNGNLDNVIEGPVREHSRKPDSFYELVEAIAPGSKVELFARSPRDGWASWGAETEKFSRGPK